MPQTNEVLEFAKSMGLSNTLVDDQARETDSVVITEKLEHQPADDDPPATTNDLTQTIVSAENGSAPAPSSSSSSSLSISSSGK
jgi:hypothetical protein